MNRSTWYNLRALAMETLWLLSCSRNIIPAPTKAQFWRTAGFWKIKLLDVWILMRSAWRTMMWDTLEIAVKRASSVPSTELKSYPWPNTFGKCFPDLVIRDSDHIGLSFSSSEAWQRWVGTMSDWLFKSRKLWWVFWVAFSVQEWTSSPIQIQRGPSRLLGGRLGTRMSSLICQVFMFDFDQLINF